MSKGERKDVRDDEFMVRRDALDCILESVMGEVVRLLAPLFEDAVVNKTALERLSRLLVHKGILDANEVKTTYFIDRERLQMLWEEYIERIETIKDMDTFLML